MDTQVFNHNANLVVDPVVTGWDPNNFARTSGAADPTVVSSKLRFNANGMTSRIYARFADAEYPVNVPQAPTAGDTRKWGFFNPGMIDRASAYFDINGTTFSCKVYDDDGNAVLNKAITWDAAWTATEVKYRIIWYKSEIRFLIDGTVVARTGQVTDPSFPNAKSTTKKQIPAPMVHIQNDEADDMDVGVIVVKDVYSLT